MTAAHRQELYPLVDKLAKRHAIDVKLLDGIIMVESNYNPWAMRYEPKYRYISGQADWAVKLGITSSTEKVCQQISWGMSQLMGGTARSLGYTGHLAQLVDPQTNVTYACQLLLRIMKRYTTVEECIAAYNAGTAYYTSHGAFVNQPYVDKVLGQMARFS